MVKYWTKKNAKGEIATESARVQTLAKNFTILHARFKIENGWNLLENIRIYTIYTYVQYPYPYNIHVYKEEKPLQSIFRIVYLDGNTDYYKPFFDYYFCSCFLLYVQEVMCKTVSGI